MTAIERAWAARATTSDQLRAEPDSLRRSERGVWGVRRSTRQLTYVEWPGLYHEMFNEVGRERVLDRVAEWLAAGLA